MSVIETNIRQRGDVGGSVKKVGKRIKELERIYGVREGSANEKGNNRIGQPNNSVHQSTQSDIAAQMGILLDTLQNYKMMADMIPELEDLMDTGIVTKTTALAHINQFSMKTLKVNKKQLNLFYQFLISFPIKKRIYKYNK